VADGDWVLDAEPEAEGELEAEGVGSVMVKFLVRVFLPKGLEKETLYLWVVARRLPPVLALVVGRLPCRYVMAVPMGLVAQLAGKTTVPRWV